VAEGVLMQARDHRIMQFIRRQAIDTERAYNTKMAAGIAIKGQLISTGRNSNRTHPFAAKYSKHSSAIYLHAETSAIANALNHVHKDELKRATLFIHRVKHPHARTAEWCDGLAKPCPGCMSAIAAFGIKRVIYSTDENGEYGMIEQTA
jgi:tRNA(Arg) A34 adenosine deaminase TadA